MRQGTRQVGIISGEAGVGKTALVHMFVAQVVATENVWMGHGQCVDHYGAGEAYLPLLEALGRLGRGPEGERLVAVLHQHAPSWLAQMPGLVSPSARERLQRTTGGTTELRMLRELTEALDVLTTERPLVLVLEDLHWSDRGTLAWLSYVARRPDPACLLLLGTYRPVDAIVHGHPLRTVLTELQHHSQCVELALDYLSDEEVMTYLRHRMEATQVDIDLARVLHQRTRGNPLFLIAVVDEILRQQAMSEDLTGWTMQGRTEAIATLIPATLRALIEHQLRQCNPEEQTLLAAASVAGVEFTAAAVAAGLEQDEEVVEAQCTALAYQGRFLQTCGHAVWPDGTVTTCYRFIHALYQEVMYQHLPAARQSRWHAQIGARLAHGFGERAGEMATTLAMHFLRGHMLSQAVQYARQAGRTAAQRGAYQEAVAYYEQALGALQQLPENRDVNEAAIDLRLDMRRLFAQLGDFERALCILSEAATLAEALGDRGRLAYISSYTADYLRVLRDYDRALAAGQHALDLGEALGDISLEAMTYEHLGVIHYYLGNYDQAIDMLRRSVGSLKDEPQPKAISRANPDGVESRSRLVFCLADIGAFTEGTRIAEEGVQMAEALNHPISLARAYLGIGTLHLLKGDLPQSIPLLERGRDVCDTWNLLNWRVLIASRLGYAYTLDGRMTEALPLLEQAVERARHTDSLVYPAAAYLQAGRRGDASTLATRVLERSRKGRERGTEALVRWLFGDIAMHDDSPDIDQAKSHYQRALTLANELGMRPLQAHCHRGLGTLYNQVGQAEQARVELSASLQMYRDMEMVFWMPETEATLANVK